VIFYSSKVAEAIAALCDYNHTKTCYWKGCNSVLKVTHNKGFSIFCCDKNHTTNTV